MKRRSNKKVNVAMITLTICFCFMAIGYAIVNQQLSINGVAKTTGNWNIQFTNIVSNPTGGATNVTTPTGIGTTTATFNVELNEPGDKMEYTITVSNLGNIDAIVESVNKTESENSNITYTVEGIQIGTELKATRTKDFKVIVEFNSSATSVSGEETKTITLSINFVQQQGSNIEAVTPSIAINDLKSLAVVIGDGLYADSTESGRYIFRGSNPDNYITFNNEEWRILSIENDGTLKIVKSNSLEEMAWDTSDNRSSSTSTYCTYPDYGCNAWAAASNLIGTPSTFTLYYPNSNTNDSENITGTVTKDSSINTYLNTTYYNTIGTDKKYIVSHDFYVGSPGSSSDTESITTDVVQEKQYTWNGNVGLVTITEYLKASTDNTCTSLSAAYDYNSTNCGTNWIKYSDRYWTISPYVDSDTFYVWRVRNNGRIDYSMADDTFAETHPVVYLSSTIKLKGNGSSTNKYTIVES